MRTDPKILVALSMKSGTREQDPDTKNQQEGVRKYDQKNHRGKCQEMP